MSLCQICGKRQAKRFCPALNEKICTICCARDRMMELACPDSCIHLQSARDTATDREGPLLARYRALKGHGPFKSDDPHVYSLLVIQTAITEVRRTRYLDLDDTEILAGLTNALKNLQTAGTGLIYEHQDASPIAQGVSKHIREKLDGLAEQAPPDDPVTHSVMVDSIELEIDRVQAHMEEGSDRRSYLRFISLFAHWEKSEHDEAKQLIVL